MQLDVYVLMNGFLKPRARDEPVAPNLFSIALASGWSTSWAAQGGQLVRLYRGVRGIGAGFHLSGIPEDYPGAVPVTNFDPRQMTALFRYAEAAAQRGYPWLRQPPGVDRRETIDDAPAGR